MAQKISEILLANLPSDYKPNEAELSRLFAFAKNECDGEARVFDTPIDYVLALDRYLESIKGESFEKPFLTKDGFWETENIERPKLFVSFLSFIGHTAKRWDAAKAKSIAHTTILEDIELYFAADGTEKAITGIYPKDVALKVLPIVLKENKDEKEAFTLNINVKGSEIDLT